LRIAMPVGPDFRQGALAIDEWIVLRDRTVPIDTDHLAEVVVEILSADAKLFGEALPERHEQVTVATEGEARAEMVLMLHLGLLPENDLDIRKARRLAVLQPAAGNGSAITAFAFLCIADVDE